MLSSPERHPSPASALSTGVAQATGDRRHVRAPRPWRFLFQAHNRRGVGHLMRGINLARGLWSRTPEADILFYIRNGLAASPGGHGFPYVVEPDGHGLSHWPEVVRTFVPDVIIYDTLIPSTWRQDPGLPSTRHVYIMRKCKEAKQQELWQHPFLERVDLVLIPHTPQDFAYVIPAALRSKCVFVGPIVRAPQREAQDRLQAKYHLGEQAFLLTSTVGGGGFTAPAEAFFQTVLGIHQRLYARLPRLRYLVIQGPYFTQRLPSLPGMTVIPYEEDMVNLFALSDLVIAEGGYNTVNEIRLAKAPAVFLPSGRTYDDQEERVRSLENMGLAVLFLERSGATVHEVVEMIAAGSRVQAMRQRYALDYMETGNVAAADKILEVIA